MQHCHRPELAVGCELPAHRVPEAKSALLEIEEGLLAQLTGFRLSCNRLVLCIDRLRTSPIAVQRCDVLERRNALTSFNLWAACRTSQMMSVLRDVRVTTQLTSWCLLGHLQESRCSALPATRGLAYLLYQPVHCCRASSNYCK